MAALSSFFLLLSMLIMVMMKELYSSPLIDNEPGCLDSCSDQVNCTVSYRSICLRNHTDGPDIAAEPVDLQVEKRTDLDHQYVYLSWRPPQDGSYNYLTAFIVRVTLISLGTVHAGIMGSYCYKIVPESSWATTHRELINQGGVFFHLNCLRASLDANVEIRVSIHSEPLKTNAPKLAVKTVIVRPATIHHSQHMWDPKFQKWADIHDMMHIRIRNPLKEARFYAVQIRSVGRNVKVFDHTFPANPDNKTHGKTTAPDSEGLPHFLVEGLKKEDNYSILMDALDVNKSIIPYVLRVETKPFHLNFTTQPLTQAVVADKSLDNRLILLVSLCIVVVVIVIVGLLWKGKPLKLWRWIQDSALKLVKRNNLKDSPRILPIYCHENDNFVRAVESHVTLVRRYVDILYVPHDMRSSCSPCGWKQPDLSWVDGDFKDSDIIIYLSPGIGEILQNENTHTPQFFSELDSSCYQSLCSLRDRRLSGQGAVPHFVTFDCFGQAELASLAVLKRFALPSQLSNSEEQLTPLKLASCDSNNWKLDNLEQLLFQLHQLQEFPQEYLQILNGWKDSREAKEVERYLSVLDNDNPETANGLSEESRISRPGNWNTRYAVESDNQQCSDSAQNTHGKIMAEDTASYEEEEGGDDKGKHFEEPDFQNVPLISHSKSFENGSLTKLSDSSYRYNGQLKHYMDSSLYCDKVELPGQRKHCSNLEEYLSPHSDQEYSSDSPPFCEMDDDTEDATVVIKDSHGNSLQHGLSYHKPNFYHNDDNINFTPNNTLKQKSSQQTNNGNGFANGYVAFLNGKTKLDGPMDEERVRKMRSLHDIIPPSLCLSNSPSVDSICERINRVNENAGWSDLNLARQSHLD